MSGTILTTMEMGKPSASCVVPTGCHCGSTNLRVFKQNGNPATRFNARQAPGLSNTRKS